MRLETYRTTQVTPQAMPTMRDFAKKIADEVVEDAKAFECSLKEALDRYLKTSCAGKGTIKIVKQILEV